MVRRPVKILSVILLLALVAVPVICPFLLQSRQRCIQHKMKERLEEGAVQTISVERHRFRWVKMGKEILFGNKLFDVKTISPDGYGNFIITGLFDDEEAIILNQMKKKRQDDESNGNKQLIQLLHLLLVLPDAGNVNGFVMLPLAGLHPFLMDSVLPAPVQNIPTPPPQA
jgi:hypothetical protein